MGWTPPSEDEFNGNWVTSLEALEVSDERFADDEDKWAIIERLRAGQIVSVARTAQIRGDVAGVRPFVIVPSGAWQRADQNDMFRFWKKGDLVVNDVRDGVIHGGKQRYFDVRFDPQTFSGRPPQMPDDHADENLSSVVVERGKEISTDEAQRFSSAIIAGWPEATEVFAHAKALAFFSENKVPREWFLGIFRSIRGPKNRGKQPKRRD